MIDFDEPRLGLLVEEDVNAENLKAELVFKVLRLRRPLNVRDLIVPRNDRFHRQFLKLLPALRGGNYLRVFLALRIDGSKDGGQASFVSEIVIRARVLHEILTLLVYRIVGQVHAEVVEIAAKRRNIILRCEPRQAFLVYENA